MTGTPTKKMVTKIGSCIVIGKYEDSSMNAKKWSWIHGRDDDFPPNNGSLVEAKMVRSPQRQ
jgi:hypothetical protein